MMTMFEDDHMIENDLIGKEELNQLMEGGEQLLPKVSLGRTSSLWRPSVGASMHARGAGSNHTATLLPHAATGD